MTGLEEGARLLLVSLDATSRSNATVGPPFEIAIYRRDDMKISQHLKLAANDPYLLQLQQRCIACPPNTVPGLKAGYLLEPVRSGNAAPPQTWKRMRSNGGGLGNV